MSMPTFKTPWGAADPEILDAELHADSRLRYVQRRMQEDEGVRMTIDNIAYVLKLNAEYERLHGRG
jgi:hypothetical protein